MKNLSNVSEVALAQLKADIRMMSTRTFLLKEKQTDISGEHLHELADLLRQTADTIDQWAQEQLD